METIRSFAPVLAPNSKLIILGSMPSVISLGRSEYYGNAQNQFWRLVFCALGEDCPAAYEDRLARLKARGVSLWDVIESCTREGSLDKNIKNAVVNPINALISEGKIPIVCFNGSTAHATYKKHFTPIAGVKYVLLPSSSPVPRRKIRTFEDKLPFWMSLRDYL